jgi:hypothetical protein
MAIKGMQQDRTGHIGPDTWKNDKQNQHRGSHEKGEQAAAAAAAALGETAAEGGISDEPEESEGASAQGAKPGKGAG